MSDKIGPVILDLIGTELSQEERELLAHPQVGGVILFSRNYATSEQLTQLCQAIRESRPTPLLIVVDQEGGRVQRFREEFTRIPSMGYIGKMYEKMPDNALKFAELCGWLMASEVLAVGINRSIAPVLDLHKTNNPVTGDRAFHRDPSYVCKLATAFMKGMHSAGMLATGKHFPGHGSVAVDSHVGLPEDTRDFNDIMTDDLQPFYELMQAGIDAIMPAHIIFSKVDLHPVSFSKHWLKKVLREQCHFSGMIMSDDLNMNGAAFAGNYPERAVMALEAGCDMILICNNRKEAITIVEHLPQKYFLDKRFSKHFHLPPFISFSKLKQSSIWREKYAHFSRIMDGFQEFVF